MKQSYKSDELTKIKNQFDVLSKTSSISSISNSQHAKIENQKTSVKSSINFVILNNILSQIKKNSQNSKKAIKKVIDSQSELRLSNGIESLKIRNNLKNKRLTAALEKNFGNAETQQSSSIVHNSKLKAVDKISTSESKISKPLKRSKSEISEWEPTKKKKSNSETRYDNEMTINDDW